MSTSTRKFKVAEGRVVVPPKSLLTAPGGKPARLEAGAELELPATSVNRFIRGRVRAGDLVEITAAPAAARKER